MHQESIDTVVPDSGPVSVTARIYDINPGEWDVNGELLAPQVGSGHPRERTRRYQLPVPGVLFLATVAAYTLCRQFVLRLRAEQRRSAVAGPLTAAGAALVLSGAILWLVVSGS